MIMYKSIYTGTSETCTYYVNMERAILYIANFLTQGHILASTPYQLNGGGDNVKGCCGVTFMIYPHPRQPPPLSPPPVQTSK